LLTDTLCGAAHLLRVVGYRAEVADQLEVPVSDQQSFDR
jgi:hypothetical protein